MYVIKVLTGSSEEIVYSSNTQDERPVVSAKGSFELNEGGSLDIVLPYGHPLYNQMQLISTYIAAYNDDEEIFYGRIIGASDPTFTGEISYQAEGAICLLKDSQIPPDARDSSGQQTSRTMTAEAFFRWCIQQHNQQLNDPRRTFTVGEVSATKRGEIRTYQIGSYTETKTALDQYITGVYGGYIRVRKSNGTHYIDWIQDYGRTNPQEILIGENVRSLTNTVTADGFYTVLLPVGNNGLTLDTPTIDLFGPTEMALYGRIIKPVTFSNVSTKQELQQMANDYVSRINMTVPCETSIQLIDMHYLDGTIPKIRLGDKFNNIHGAVGTEFTVGHMDVDFISPENDSFSFRNKHDIEGDLTGGSRNGGISRSASRSSGGIGMSLKYYKELDDEAIINAKTIQLLGSTVHTQGENIDSLSAIVDDQGEAIQTIQGTEVIQNSTEIANVAGKFQVLNNYYDDWPDWQAGVQYKVGDKVKVLGSQGGYYGYICTRAHTSSVWSSDRPQYWTEHHGRQGVRLLDGSALEIDDDNGIRMTVGTRINDVQGQVDSINANIDVFVGSALWTQRDNITGIAGEYELQTDPVTGKKVLVIRNGGGFRLRYNNTEYGIFHEGNLEGGMLVKAINTGSYTGVRTVWFSSDYKKAYSDPAKAHEVAGQAGIMYIDASNSAGENSRYEWDSANQKYKLMATYETHIKGDRVIVGTVDDQTAQTMQSKFGELDGLVAAKATIGQLNALSARVSNIEADYITTQNLVTEVARATKITTRALDVGGNLRVVGDQGNAYTVTFGNYVTTNISSPNTYDYEGTSVDMRKAFYDVEKEVNGNEVTLVFKTMYGLSTQEKRVTFNRAASVNLTGSWSSSRTFTVTETNSGETYSETPVYSTGAGYSQYDSITVNSFSSAHYAYARVSSSSNQGGNVLFGFKIDANGQYNSGWDYGQTQITRATRAATSQETTVKTLDYSERFAIVDTYTKSDGTTSEIKYIVEAKADRYSDGQAAVTLTDPSWNSISTLTSSRTVTVSTSGRPTKLSKSKTVFLTTGLWSSGSIPIYIRDGSTSGTIVAQSSVSLPGISGFDTQAPANESYTNGEGITFTNNSDGYMIRSTGSSGMASIVVRSTWTQGGSTITGKSYLSGAPTALYRAAYSSGDTAGYNRSAAESPTGFSSDSLANESYAIPGGSTITNNSDGYYLQSSGSSGVAYIVVTGSWTQSGHRKTSTNYLRGAPTAIYRKGYSDGAASSASPEWIGQGYVANTNNLPDGTKHSLSGLKTVIVDNRSKQGYIYFRIKISGTYHVYYFVDNGNGWTS